MQPITESGKYEQWIAQTAAKRLLEEGHTIAYQNLKDNGTYESAMVLAESIRQFFVSNLDQKREYHIAYNIVKATVTLDRTIYLVHMAISHKEDYPVLIPESWQ